MSTINDETRKRAMEWVRETRAGSDDFHKAMVHVLKWEGGYVNHPNDPGGETNYGISKRAYPSLDIKNLTKKDATAIDYFDYWRPMDLDKFEFGLAVSIFDAAINVGVGRVRSWLREFHVPVTAELFNARREQYYKDLAKEPRFSVFLKGWLNRLSDLRQFITIKP